MKISNSSRAPSDLSNLQSRISKKSTGKSIQDSNEPNLAASGMDHGFGIELEPKNPIRLMPRIPSDFGGHSESRN